MKAILLACATLSAVACASEPSAAVRVPAHKTSGEADRSPVSRGDGDESARGLVTPAASPDPTTTTEPAPTTSTAPEPVATTQAPVVEPPATTPPRPVRTTVTTAYVAPEAPSGRCGGSLPPCWVMNAESGGSLTAVNYGGCGGRGCYGKWQFDPRTSQGLGYPLTMDQYPESVQDEAARTLWNGGRGCSHWGAC